MFGLVEVEFTRILYCLDKEAVATQQEKEEDLHGAPTCPNPQICPDSSFCDIRVFRLNKFKGFFICLTQIQFNQIM